MKFFRMITLGLLILSGCAVATPQVETSAQPAVAPEKVIPTQAEAAPVPSVPVTPVKTEKKAVVVKLPTPGVQRLTLKGNPRLFMTKNLQKEGVKNLAKGVHYRVITAGSGASPMLEDSVDIRYRATRADGSLYATTDSKDNRPRTLQVKKILSGLRQALLKMAPGAKWEVVIAPTNRNEATARGRVLIYELELVAVYPTAS